MNRQILRLAIPNIISNISIPLLSLVHIAIAGRIGGESVISALAIGTSIFNLIYWIFSFIRMGTSGLTAQAYGAEDRQEITDILARSVIIALAIGLVLIVANRPLGRICVNIMHGSEQASQMALEYFYARIWAVPAGIANFALQGWYIGMQDSKNPMIVAIASNIINAVFCVLFVFEMDLGIAGIGFGTVVAQYSGLALYLGIWLRKYGLYRHFIRLKESFDMEKMVRFLHINKDIFLRTLCIVIVYTFFTAASARFGDTILATNTILMELFLMFSYMTDGFAYAAESLVGRFVGAKDGVSLRKSIGLLFLWSAVAAVLYAGTYLGFWRDIMWMFSDSAEIVACAGEYIWWVIFIIVICFVPFLIDGILVGATKTKVLRNSVFISTAVFFGLFYSLAGWLGNTAIWIAFSAYVISRGIYLVASTDKLGSDYLIDINRN